MRRPREEGAPPRSLPSPQHPGTRAGRRAPQASRTISALSEGRGKGCAHESQSLPPPLASPSSTETQERSGRMEEARYTLPATENGARRRPSRKSPEQKDFKKISVLQKKWHNLVMTSLAESQRARPPAPLGDPPGPRSRVRKWRGKHGSVPGRRGHHVQCLPLRPILRPHKTTLNSCGKAAPPPTVEKCLIKSSLPPPPAREEMGALRQKPPQNKM